MQMMMSMGLLCGAFDRGVQQAERTIAAMLAGNQCERCQIGVLSCAIILGTALIPPTRRAFLPSRTTVKHYRRPTCRSCVICWQRLPHAGANDSWRMRVTADS